MPRTFPRALVLGTLLLGACELIVDPARQPTGSTGSTTAGTGSTGTAASTGSATSTTSSGSSGSSTTTASSSSSSSAASSSSSAGSSSSGSGSSGASASSSSGAGSTGSSGTTATTSVGTTSGSSGSTGCAIDCATCTACGGVCDQVHCTCTGIVSCGGSGSTIGSTGAAGSTGTTATTGTCLPPGTTGSQSADCGGFDGGTADAGFTPRSQWAIWTQPDSLSTCSNGGACALNGSDEDYAYPISRLCPTGALKLSGTANIDFDVDLTTGIGWEQGINSGDFIGASSLCVPSAWDFDDGGHPKIGVPTVAQQLSLLDFNGSSELLPAALTDTDAGFWASAGDSSTPTTYVVDFHTGAFGPATSTATEAFRCALGAASTPSLNNDACLSTGNGGQDCAVMLANGRPLDGLEFHEPAGDNLTWQGALDYCNNLNGCGVYRLANYKELATLANFTTNSSGSNLIDALSSGQVFWSSTTAPGDATSAMVVEFHNGNTPSTRGYSASKAASHSAYCVVVQ